MQKITIIHDDPNAITKLRDALVKFHRVVILYENWHQEVKWNEVGRMVLGDIRIEVLCDWDTQ